MQLKGDSATDTTRSSSTDSAMMSPRMGGRSIPLQKWIVEQSSDESLGPLVAFLRSKTTDTKNVSNHLRSRAQSYRLINGILHYRSLRDIGLFDINQGWVIAVPASLQERVISL